MTMPTFSEAEIVASFNGVTITKAALQPTKYPDEFEALWLYLADGRVIEVAGYPVDYGADGAVSVEVIRVVHVPACRHCGRPHGDRKIYGRWPIEYDPTRPPGKEFAFCTDGMHAAWVAG